MLDRLFVLRHHGSASILIASVNAGSKRIEAAGGDDTFRVAYEVADVLPGCPGKTGPPMDSSDACCDKGASRFLLLRRPLQRAPVGKHMHPLYVFPNMVSVAVKYPGDEIDFQSSQKGIAQPRISAERAPGQQCDRNFFCGGKVSAARHS